MDKQEFLILGKSAKGRALCELISRATGEPGIHTFGELLDLPNVQELSGEHAPYKALLELFCYGTWSDYQAHKASLPPLSAPQELKLKQLTAASLAGATKVLPYAQLQAGLAIGTVRALEDFLITDCFYTGLITGKLDQRSSCLQVHDAASRDVRPADTPALAAALGNWLATAQVLLAQLEGEASAASSGAASAAARRREVEAAREELRRSLKVEYERGGGERLLLDDADGGGGGYDMLDDSSSDGGRGGGGAGGSGGPLAGGGSHGGGGSGPGVLGRPKSRRR